MTSSPDRVRMTMSEADFDLYELGLVTQLAAFIRSLPLAADTIEGKRQAWVRECCACVIEGRALPPDPTLPADDDDSVEARLTAIERRLDNMRPAINAAHALIPCGGPRR